MRNFARLARHAWPYRVRFFLSIACAMMVALLWFTNLSAVYPLLQILFHSQNCQKWISEELVTNGVKIRSLEVRLETLALVEQLATGGPEEFRELKERLESAEAAWESASKALRLSQKAFDELGNEAADALPLAQARMALAQQRYSFAQSEARYEELRFALPRSKEGDRVALAERRPEFERNLAKAKRWQGAYLRAQPYVNRFLPADGFHTLLLLIGAVMLCIAVKGVFMFSQEVLVADINQLVLFDIRNLFFRRTIRLDLESFNDRGTAELMSRFTNDMDSLAQGLSTLLSKVVREPLRIFACLGGAFWFNWRLTCLTLIVVPISAAATFRVGKVMKRAVRRSLESMSNIYKILQESFQGIKIVKAFTMERHERIRFYRETKALYRKSVRVAMIDALSDPVLEMLSLVTVSIALLAGSYLVLRHTQFLDLGIIRLQLSSREMSIEDLLTLYAMLAGVSDPIRKLSNVHSKIQRAAAASDRICALMDREPQVADKPSAIPLHRHVKQIEFERVWFRYSSGDYVLKGIDLTVKHGETIAIVGPNGCGKSTLLNLIPRFWDVDSGAIRIDGVDLRDYRVRSLRRQISMVTQETILFDDTVARNIAYGSSVNSREEIIEAAKRAHAHSFINNLPQGYDTQLGERGTGLSGGQRQRMALARAMLRDPAILILDEATSAVDIQDEALIRQAIEQFARGRTVFLITHNLSSLQLADRIVLMNDGCIEAMGTDEELRRTSALYRKLNEIHFQRETA